MIFSRWFRRQSRPSPSPRFRPTVFLLEDRTVPSTLFGGFGFRQALFTPPGPTTHLQVVTQTSVQSGRYLEVLVKALDANNRIATSYTGTIHFSLGLADTAATVPSDYTFTTRDRGVEHFRFRLSTTGSQTITATDTAVNSTIFGFATLTVNPAPVATQFIFIAPPVVLAGGPIDVTLVALDASGKPTTNYTGKISFSSSDQNLALPDDYQFLASDFGRHHFEVNFQTTGTQTLTATDTQTASITGQASVTVDAVGAVTHFGVFTWPVTFAGSHTQFGIAALDASNNVVAGYTGTVHFTSSDTKATLPADYTFTSSDNGFHILPITFKTSGNQSLTATDVAANSVTASINVWVLSHLFPFPGFGQH